MRALVFPGQGAQRRGMGRDVFDAYPETVEAASEVLGYSVRTLCLEDPDRRLRDTAYTQPALFVVGALAHRRWREEHGDGDGIGDGVAYAAGHSLGEYCALHAAGAFDFETGLRLVQRRGALMAEVRGGGMAAVVGVEADRLAELLAEGGFTGLSVANDNTPTQQVFSGETGTIGALVDFLESRRVRCARLNVSGAFHSPLMAGPQREFARFLAGFALGDPRTPVIANATARPYGPGETAQLLVEQIAAPVRWTETVHRLLDLGVTDFVELGGSVVGKLIDRIRAAPRPASAEPPRPHPETPGPYRDDAGTPRPAPSTPAVPLLAPAAAAQPGPAPAAARAEGLGSEVFRRRLGLRYAYLGGAMYRGIASAELVVALGRAGMLGFLGSGGLPLPEVERGIRTIREALPEGRPYGVNLLADHDDPAAERAVVDLLLRHRVPVVEASAFIGMTPALVRYRASGLRRGPDGAPVCDHRVVAKVSRPEVAAEFMAPPPRPVLEQLRAAGALTDEQVELAREVPMSHDITVEADSGGHTDGGVATVLMPAMLALRDRAQQRYGYREPLCLGLAGGLGTPSAVAAAFLLGADYVLTGSVNQCTVESGASVAVKDMLADIGIDDTGYAPAGDLFEMGAQVQVLRKGVFFPTRANRLFALYSHHDGLDDIPAQTRALLERTYFRRGIDEVWDEVCRYLRGRGREAEIERAESRPKLKMSLVFRWYFFHTTRLAMAGDSEDRVNYQVHTGPALGAFNEWVRGTDLQPWRNRHVDRIGLELMEGAAAVVESACRQWQRTLGLAPDPGPYAAPDPQPPAVRGPLADHAGVG